VSARSDGPGRGAEFEVRLPLAGAPTLAAAGPVLPAPTKRRRVLVIEDNDDGRDMLATALRMDGHEVLDAATGREGVELAARHTPQVLLIDIGLPDVDGYEVCRTLRRQLAPTTRLIALTGYGQPQDRERAMQAGFDDHLVKPVDPHRLREALREPETG
jgi:CheY-like chemotaxis protein